MQRGSVPHRAWRAGTAATVAGVCAHQQLTPTTRGALAASDRPQLHSFVAVQGQLCRLAASNVAPPPAADWHTCNAPRAAATRQTTNIQTRAAKSLVVPTAALLSVGLLMRRQVCAGRHNRRRALTIRAAAAEAEAPSEEERATDDQQKSETVAEEVGAQENGATNDTEEASETAGEEDGEKVEAKTEKQEERKEDKKKPPKWTCTACGHLNFPGSQECDKCGAARPSQAEMDLFNERTQAKDEVGTVMDDFLRLQAELQNYRRQHTESMSKAASLGKQDALRKLLPFNDEIDAALIRPDGLTEKEEAFFTSYSLLFRKISDVWGKFGVERLEVKVGDKFDAIKHRKVQQREASEGQAPGTILEVLKPGWKCEGQTVLPSEVVMAALPPKQDEPSTSAGADAADDEEMAADDGPAEGEVGNQGGEEEKSEVREGAAA